MKVFLQSPWSRTDSPYYNYLRERPPNGIEYINAEDFGLIQNKSRLKFNNWLKQFVKKLVRNFYPSMPNAHYTLNADNYDLIHCAHCISKNKAPWVCDIEFVGQFWAGGPYNNFPSKRKVLKYLQGPYCKRILAWTEWSKDGILKEFPEIRDKVEILYPAVPVMWTKKSFSKNINLLFVGRDFRMKGGEIALKVFDKLTRMYSDVYATVVSDVPHDVLKKYKLNNKIEFCGSISHKKLFGEIYSNADIFLYPTFSDTFGFAILEAQSFGLPVVAMKTRSTHTIGETITDGETGFVVENLAADAIDRIVSKDVVGQIGERVEKLIKDRKKLRAMSMNCLKEIANGKFSVGKRNEKLGNVYGKAVA